MPRFGFQLFLTAALVLLAGSYRGAAQTTTTTVTFRAIAFETAPGLENVVFRDGDGQLTEVALSKLSFSEEYTVSTSQGIAFYSEDILRIPESAKATEFEPAAFVPVVESSSELLLVFVPVEKDDGSGYKVWPVRSDNKRFSLGGVMFLNFSGHAMVAKIGDARVELPSGTPALVPYAGEGDRFNGQIQIAVYIEQNWRKFYSSQWTIPRQSKTLVMIYSSSITGLPLLRSVSYRM